MLIYLNLLKYKVYRNFEMGRKKEIRRMREEGTRREQRKQKKGCCGRN